MTDPLGWIGDDADSWVARGLHRRLVPHGPAPPGRIVLGGRELVNYGSNDYLGVAADPRVVATARRAAQEYGWGAGASPLLTGWTEIHQDLADALARFEQVEAVALFPSGFAANLGAITPLVQRGDAVYVDRLAHASLVDGARLSGARLRVFPHNDVDRLETHLRRERDHFRRVLIVTEGLFSMDGDLAPVADLVELAERFEAMLLVDEAHATGVLGVDGRGAAALCGVADRVSVRVGTLSKALGSVGGFVAGSSALIDRLVNHARSLIYSTGLPPAAAAAAREALAIVVAEPERRERLSRLASRLRAGLVDAGCPVGEAAGPIVPVVLGATEVTLATAAQLRERGFLVPAIRAPTVPNGSARLRVSLSAAHGDAEIEALIAAFGEL